MADIAILPARESAIVGKEALREAVRATNENGIPFSRYVREAPDGEEHSLDRHVLWEEMMGGASSGATGKDAGTYASSHVLPADRSLRPQHSGPSRHNELRYRVK